MKSLRRFALAATIALASAGAAEAMPMASLGASAMGPMVERTAVTVTKTVRRGPLGGRIVTKRVVRHGLMGGRRVTVTKTVR